jgi:hypothetical protein
MSKDSSRKHLEPSLHPMGWPENFGGKIKRVAIVGGGGTG